jgi:hypothetical protein
MPNFLAGNKKILIYDRLHYQHRFQAGVSQGYFPPSSKPWEKCPGNEVAGIQFHHVSKIK